MYIFNKNFKKKGFSLIELIVVMGIMAIIILIAVPKFMGYTKEARLTKIKASTKEIESASDRYYLKNDDWPRATSEDDYYSKDELESYAKEIYDKTGAIINLEETGHYYDIDYVALKNYVRVPDDSVKYIIQNPVGRVYYLDKLTPEGEEIFNNKTNKESIPPGIKEPELEPSDDSWFKIDSNGNVSASDKLKALAGPINLIIPSEINGQTVTKIADYGFNELNNIAHVEIPNTVTIIGNIAFDCSSISSVNIPNSVKTIGNHAFSSAFNLTEIVLPDSVTSIGSNVFYNSFNITNIRLSNNIIAINDFAFHNLTKINTIEIPASVTKISLSAFKNWTNSQTVLIKARNNTNITIDNLLSVSKFVFEDKDDYFIINSGSVSKHNLLPKITGPIDLIIPSEINGQTVTKIADYGFNDLTNIAHVEIPNTVTIIGNIAFDCSSISSVNIPNSVKTIGNHAFSSAFNLTEIVLPDSVTSIGSNVFYNSFNIINIRLSNNITVIDDSVFYNLTKINTIEIPASVTKISLSAFKNWTNSQTIKLIGRTDTTGMTLGSGWFGSALISYE